MIIQKYRDRVIQVNSLVSVGLDSDITRIPSTYLDQPYPQYVFNKMIIEKTHPYVCAYKINTAFYEARGADGWHDLQLTMDYLTTHHPDILTICDAKRADIGNTNVAYTKAIFDQLAFDALTLHPYLGHEAVQPFLDRDDKACIFLCKTSNSGSGELQDLMVGDVPLWSIIAQKVASDWDNNSNCMLVVGATYPEDMQRVRQIVGDMPLLVPGIGAQGGDIQQIMSAGLDSQQSGLIINSSRKIIFADNPEAETLSLRDAINQYRSV